MTEEGGTSLGGGGEPTGADMSKVSELSLNSLEGSVEQMTPDQAIDTLERLNGQEGRTLFREMSESQKRGRGAMGDQGAAERARRFDDARLKLHERAGELQAPEMDWDSMPSSLQALAELRPVDAKQLLEKARVDQNVKEIMQNSRHPRHETVMAEYYLLMSIAAQAPKEPGWGEPGYAELEAKKAAQERFAKYGNIDGALNIGGKYFRKG